MIALTHTADFTATHREPLLPSWHACAWTHGHEWTITLEVIAQDDDFTEDVSVAVHTALAEFDRWVAEQLEHRHLNDVDEALAARANAPLVARWVYDTWVDRLPHLAAVRVSGPLVPARAARGPARYERYEYTYRPAPIAGAAA
ncbi:6-pyruvoyl trahydropterin synthase family protein [Streptomyces harbinensis]|uniref:6-pyruvoyl trahydropterin synthase family protein n=1 Tax=Streptomyces harbinensis TaxID=1176198 RepID=UPI0034DF118B